MAVGLAVAACWGVDATGVMGGDHAIYVDIDSRSEDGPSPQTLNSIYDALVGLGNKELTGLVHSMRKLVMDGLRTGIPPVQCDITCVNNTNAPT